VVVVVVVEDPGAFQINNRHTHIGAATLRLGSTFVSFCDTLNIHQHHPSRFIES
jgi:hypothetical protein